MEIDDVRLMGQTEIAERTGWSRQRTYIITGRREFPAPRWTLAMGKIWWADDVEQWLRENRPDLTEEAEQ
jgi:predicted DNA-binding transcriptional regulator AlpA